MGDITKRQKEILRYIKDFMIAHGTTPSIREIGEGVGLYSTSTVHAHFQRLVDCGYIEQIGDKSYRYKVKGMEYREVEDGKVD